MCIFMAMHHTFTDGYGAFAFCNYWMRLMRGEEPPYKLVYERPKCVEVIHAPLSCLFQTHASIKSVFIDWGLLAMDETVWW